MVIWEQKLQQTNMLPGKRLRVTGGFGKAEVVCEPLSAVSQKRPLNYSHSCSWEGPGGVVCYQFTSLHDTCQWWLSWPGLCPADRCELSGHILQSTVLGLHLNVQISCFLPAAALGSLPREGRLPSLDKHVVRVWPLTEKTVIYFSASSTSCMSPFGNIEEKVEGKRRGLLCTSVVCDICTTQCDGMSAPLPMYS